MQKKHYYKISDITETLGISPRTIRYYDQYGLLPHVKRSKGNIRLFDDSDIELLKKIRLLQSTKGLPLEDIKKHLLGNTDNKKNTRKLVFIENKAKLNLLENFSAENVYSLENSFKVGEEYLGLSEYSSVEDLWSLSLKNQHIIEEPANDSESLEQEIRSKINEGVEDIYIVSSSCTSPVNFKALSNAVEKISFDFKDIHLIDTQSLCVAQGLFIYLLLEAIDNNRSKKEIEILIRKYSKASFSFILSAQVSFLYGSKMKSFSDNDTNLFRNAVMKQVNELKPLFKFDSFKNSLTFLGAHQGSQQSFIELFSNFELHFDEQGRYAQCISIAYQDSDKEAKQLEKMIRDLHGTVPIDLTPMSTHASIQYGRESLVLSVI